MKTYKAASTNVDKGYKTHGPHKIVGQLGGQKKGKKSDVGKEKTGKSEQLHKKLRKISKAMFAKNQSANTQMAQRAQLNA